MAKSDCIAHDHLAFGQPCWAKVCFVDALFGSLIEQCRMSCASVRSVFEARASVISWYGLALRRSCQGIHLIAPRGLNH